MSQRDITAHEEHGERCEPAARGAALCVSWRDDDGIEQTAESDSLEGLAANLETAGYEGGSLRVTDEPGFTVGWVSAGHWRAG